MCYSIEEEMQNASPVAGLQQYQMQTNIRVHMTTKIGMPQTNCLKFHMHFQYQKLPSGQLNNHTKYLS